MMGAGFPSWHGGKIDVFMDIGAGGCQGQNWSVKKQPGGLF